MGRRPNKTLDERTLNEALTLHRQGMSWDALSRRFNVGTGWLRYRLDDEFRARRIAEAKERSGYSSRELLENCNAPLTSAELKERLALIPIDNRDLTAKMMGDPIRPDPRRSLPNQG